MTLKQQHLRLGHSLLLNTPPALLAGPLLCPVHTHLLGLLVSNSTCMLMTHPLPKSRLRNPNAR